MQCGTAVGISTVVVLVPAVFLSTKNHPAFLTAGWFYLL
jgi:hypothetical protein